MLGLKEVLFPPQISAVVCIGCAEKKIMVVEKVLCSRESVSQKHYYFFIHHKIMARRTKICYDL